MRMGSPYLLLEQKTGASYVPSLSLPFTYANKQALAMS